MGISLISSRVIIAALLSLILFTFICPVASAAELTAIDTVLSVDQSQAILHLDGIVRFSAHCLNATRDKPARYYVDMYSTRPDATLPKYSKIADKHIASVRLGIHGTITRVVFDLAPQNVCSAQRDSKTQNIIVTCKPLADSVASHTPKVDEGNPFPYLAHEASSTLILQPITEYSQQLTRLVAAPDGQLIADFPAVEVAAAKAFSVDGHILGFAANDIRDDANEDQRLQRLRSRLRLQHGRTLQDNLNLQMRASLEWDILDTDDKYAGNDNDLNIYEGYFKLSGEQWDLSIGRQRVRWGKSDQLSPLDSINPDDLRQFITLDLEERKIPSWLARGRVHGSSFTVETIVMPWFEEAKLDYFDSDWALYRNLRQTIADNVQLPQALREYAVNLHVHERQPANSLNSMSGAVRLSWQTDNSDYAVSYRYGWETLPTITSFPVKNISFNGDPDSRAASFLNNAVLTNQSIEARFRRQKIVGFEWESVFDPIGFRGEVAYLDHVSLLASDLTSIGKKVAHLVTGIDYTSADDLYLNLQASWYRIFGYDKRILYFEQDNIALLGEIRKTFWRGNLELSTRYNYTISDGSSYLQPALKLKYFTNLECEVGVMVFSGGGTTLFGSYDKADQMYVRMKFSF